jgi:hypothetical protein
MGRRVYSALVTILGAAFAVAGLVVFLVRRTAYPWVLSAAAAFPTSAAVTAGTNAVNPFYMLAIPALVSLSFSTARYMGPGKRSLLLFVGWSLAITAIGPWIFEGIDVLVPREGIDTGLLDPESLSYTTSNLAQVIYLLVAIGFVFFIVRSGASPHLPAAAFGVGTVLTSSNLIATAMGVTWPHALFDTAFVKYQTSTFDGVSRLRGVFAEPSLLAEFSIAATVYFLFMAIGTRRRVRAAYAALSVLAFVNLLASATGTGVVSTLVAGVLIAVYFCRYFLQMRRYAPAILSFVMLTCFGVWIFWGAQIFGWIEQLIVTKVGSHSQITRFGADIFSYDIFLDTFGLGIGLGSNRPSSFIASLLSCVGVIGILTFFFFVVPLIHRSAKIDLYKASAWALIAGLIAKSVAIPDISSPYFWLLVATCAVPLWHRIDRSARRRAGTVGSRNQRLLLKNV